MIILPNALEGREHSCVHILTVCKVGLIRVSRLNCLNFVKAIKNIGLHPFRMKF